MFTGLIRTPGEFMGLINESGGTAIRIRTDLEDLELGDSVAVCGMCLTVSRLDRKEFSADITPVSLKRSKFSGLSKGALLNLEPALRLSDRLDGHLVSGHVDGIGRVVTVFPEGNMIRLEIECPAEDSELAVPRGSIAIDGISLTIQEKRGLNIGLAIIPHTFFNTNLKGLLPGSPVHVEYDLLARYARGAGLKEAVR